MKKVITILFLLVYSVASFGGTVRVHYCMEKFVGFELFHNNSSKDTCAKCGMKTGATKKACCKDETKQIKIEKAYKLTESVYKSFIAFSKKRLCFKSNSIPASLETASKYYHAPTLSIAKTVPIYVFDCIYRI